MTCPKCQGFMILDPGPLAFDDYRCLNLDCRHTLRRPHGQPQRKPLATTLSASALKPTAADYCITQIAGAGRRRKNIPRAERMARGLCRDCCVRLDRPPSPRCKNCRARVCASVRKVYLKKHPGARSYKKTVNA